MYERSYHSKVLKQAELPKEKRPFNWRRTLTVLGSILAVVAVVVLIRLPQLQIKSVDVEGVGVADPEELKQFIRDQITGNYLFILPKSSMLLVPTTSITKLLATEFPLFETVDVRRKGINGLSVTVREHGEKYLWCKEGDCFFMNAEGLVFAPAPTFSGNAYVKLYGGERLALPFSPLTGEQLDIVQLLLERLPTIDIMPTEIRFVSEHRYDVTFSRYNRDVTIMFGVDNDIEYTLESLYTAFRTPSFSTQYRDESKILRYIDLRFPNKIVYKFE